MKKNRSIISLMLAVMVCVMLSGCADSSVLVTNHDRPVYNLFSSISHKDGSTYLNCFTPASKKAYLASKDSAGAEKIVAAVLEKSGLESDSELSCEIISRTEISDSEREKLQRQYKKSYSKNDTIEKAFLLSAAITDGKRTIVKDFTVVLIESNWYIYGDVIESFKF